MPEEGLGEGWACGSLLGWCVQTGRVVPPRRPLPLPEGRALFQSRAEQAAV